MLCRGQDRKTASGFNLGAYTVVVKKTFRYSNDFFYNRTFFYTAIP